MRSQYSVIYLIMRDNVSIAAILMDNYSKEKFRVEKQDFAKYRGCIENGIVDRNGILRGKNSPLATIKDVSCVDEKDNSIYLYTDKSYLSKCVGKSNDAAFVKVKNNISFLKKCEYYIYLVDDARIIDYSRLTIETPNGITSIDNLSTGLKTILVALYHYTKNNGKPLFVNIDECGDNVIKILFDMFKGTKVGFYISHDILEMPEQFNYFVNDVKLSDTMDFADYLYN